MLGELEKRPRHLTKVGGSRRCAGRKVGARSQRQKVPGRAFLVLRDKASMSLYYEAAAILANSDNVGGSLKSRIYNKKDLKSTPGQLFALIAETSKWSLVLKDVIEKCKLLAEEKKVHISNTSF